MPQSHPNGFDSATLAQLVCPVCFGILEFHASGQQIHCIGCLRCYPLVDGIPILIPARGSSPNVSGENLGYRLE